MTTQGKVQTPILQYFQSRPPVVKPVPVDLKIPLSQTQKIVYVVTLTNGFQSTLHFSEESEAIAHCSKLIANPLFDYMSDWHDFNAQNNRSICTSIGYTTPRVPFFHSSETAQKLGEVE